jgi:hypothetical protein
MKKYCCLISILALFTGCYKEKQPAVTDVIPEFYASTYTAPADGATVVKITADIPGNTVSSGYNLTFFSTQGLFYDTQKSSTTLTTLRPQPDSNYRAVTAQLVCPADTCTGTVTVTSTDISRSLNIKFVFAYPQSVKLSTSTQFVVTTTATNESTLTLNLVRNPGIATPGITAQAEALDTLNNPIGNFRNGSTVFSDKTGNATFYFSPNQTPYVGKVKIKAWLPNTTPMLADSLYINLTH